MSYCGQNAQHKSWSQVFMFWLVPHAEKGTLTDMEQEELMMLVPPLFSIKDIPEETVYVYLPSWPTLQITIIVQVTLL